MSGIISNLEALFYDVSGVASVQLKKNKATDMKPDTPENKKIRDLLGLDDKDETVKSGKLVELKNQAIKELLNIQGKFGEANGQLSTLIMQLNSKIDKSGKAKIQGDIDDKQAEYQTKLRVPVTRYYDQLSIQLEIVGDGVRLNSASGVANTDTALTQISQIAASGVVGASGVDALK